MSKRAVNKRMIYLDWTGDWKTVDVVAETDVSVWVKPRMAGAEPRRWAKTSTSGRFYELDEIDEARARLRDKAEMARKKAATAVDHLARLDVFKAEMEKRERAQDETFELARMQQD